MSNPNRSALEQLVRNWLARFARLLLWEQVESVRSFIEVLTPCIANKMEPELASALRKGRVEHLEKRAFRWLERSFWEDLRHYPDDPLDKRILRLKKLFDSIPKIPKRQGDSEHFPISVFIEYDSLRISLEPIFKRRPAKVTSLSGEQAKSFAVGTSQGERGWGWRRRKSLEISSEKRFQRWKQELLQRANSIIPIEFWPKDHEAWLTEDVIIELTAQTAALKILGAKMALGEEAVLKLVKEGKEMLPPEILKRLEGAYANVADNSAWQFLNQIDPFQ
jgi:hypothetical protein